MEKKQIVVHNDRAEALKKWMLSLFFVSGGVYLINLGIAEDKLRYLVAGTITAVFFFYPLYHYAKYIVLSRPLLILDNDGVSTEDGTHLMRWGEVKHFYFDRGRAFVRLAGVKETGELVSFPIYSVISVKKLTAVLRGFGARVV